MEQKNKKIIEYEERIQTLELEIQDYTTSIKAKEKQVIHGYEQMDQMLKDVEEQRDAVKAKSDELQNANEFINRISNTMDEVLIVLGMDGKVQKVNQKLLKLLGHREKKVIGEFPDFLFSPEDLDLFREKYLAEKDDVSSVVHATFASKRKFECKAHLLGKNDKRLIHLFRSSLLISPGGKKEGVVIIGTDIEELIRTQNSLSSALAEVTALKEKIEKTNTTLEKTLHSLWGEMQLAKRIQSVLLPKNPRIDDYEISAYLLPTDDVGGDYYDVVNVKGMDWILIGDVSGHGVSAGLVMMMAHSAIHTTLIHHPDIAPSKLLSIVNQTITENIERLGEQKYMTITVLAVQEKGKFFFSGLHLQILLFRAETNQVESIDTRGMWIGIEEDISAMLQDDSLEMKVGDVLMLYTDGITESTGHQGEMFTSKKLIDILGRSGSSPTEEIKNQVLAELKNYKIDDDVTLLVIKRMG